MCVISLSSLFRRRVRPKIANFPLRDSLSRVSPVKSKSQKFNCNGNWCARSDENVCESANTFTEELKENEKKPKYL